VSRARLAATPRFAGRVVPIALAAVAIDVIGFGIVNPVLPTLITRLTHEGLASAARISGWMLAVFAITQFFAGPVLGNLGDRFGRRPVLLSAMVAFAIDYSLMALAPTIGWLFLGRAIAGITGATFGAVGAVIADVTEPDRRAINYGYLSAAMGIGFIVGPALGGLAGTLGPRAPFWLASGLAIANALTMYLFLPETLRLEDRRPFALRDAHVIGAFRPLFAAGNAAPLILACFLYQVGVIVYPSTWAFWTKIRFGWTDMQIGMSLATVGALQLMVQLCITDRAIRFLGERRAAIVGLACAATSLALFGFTVRGWQVYGLFVIGSFGALAWPALNSILSRMVDGSRQGAVQGGLGSVNSIAAVVGPVIAAQSLAWGTLHHFDGAAFLLAGALTAIGSLIVLFGFRDTRAGVHPGAGCDRSDLPEPT